MRHPLDSRRKISTTILLALSLIIPLSCYAQSRGVKTRAASPKSDKGNELDAGRALEHVRRLTAIGPRPSGSAAIRKAQELIRSELKAYGLKVIEDDFSAVTPNGAVPMKNIIGELQGQKPGVVVISGHYDTKLQDGFVGANDGGSSTAAVLETARVLAKTKPEYTLWFVFFDGEEAVVDWNAMDGRDNTYGSRHLASRLMSDGTISNVKALVLFDMIGDKNLDIKREGESTSWMVDAIWNTARALGYHRQFIDIEQYISDDHLPFKEAGVPVVDLIDFNYGPRHSYWHTNLDTLDKISGESIKIVGDVVVRALPEIFKHLDNSSVAPSRNLPRKR